MAKDNLIKIGGELKSVAADGVVAGAEAIYDYTEGKSQATINQDLKDAIEDIDVTKQISGKLDKTEAAQLYQPKGNYLTEHQDISGKVDKITGKGLSTNDYTNAEKQKVADALVPADIAGKANTSDVYTKSETYSKTEVNNLITTPNQEYVTVAATAQTTAVTDVLPATGAADTTYRVGNWDGTQYNDSVFSEYAWDGSAYIKLSTKSQVGEVYDISANHADTKYADLSAALDGGNNIPQSVRKGGMSVKFVQSSDNKYVQYFLTKDEWSIDENDWKEMSIGIVQPSDTDDDFDISDEVGNIIVKFHDGDVETKKFNSANTPKEEDRDLGDLSIEDESGKCIAIFEDGEFKTKNFDSSLLKSQDDADFDYSVQDNNGNIIVGIFDGYPITKNFNGRAINKRITELEDKSGELEGWSKMPALGENPLSFVRFDGGMGRIFRTWGFIGDSLNSGEMYGRITDVLSLAVAYDGYAISGGALSPQSGSIVTEEYAVSAYRPKLRLVFQSNSGLSGKVLVASVSDNAYSTILTGDTATTYTISLTRGQSIVISYPSSNTPQILFGSTYVSDMYDLSWGQQMVRMLGSSGYNFSVGGEYCKRWCIGADNDRRWQKAQTELKDAYTLALGVNDRSYWLANNTATVDYPCVSAYPNQSEYGSLTITRAQVLADIDLGDYNNNANSYAGWYAGIIQRLKSVRSDAHIFCITNPGEGGGKEWNQTIRFVVEIMQEKYGDTIWLIDLATYNPNTSEINANCNLNGHWSAFGYLYAAYEISTYIDWLIRKNIDAFRGTSLIGTGSSVEEWTIV